MPKVQRCLFCLALLLWLRPSNAVAQTDVTLALEAVLDCEAAEHAAWLYGFRQHDERYTMGTERQQGAAYDRILDVTEACAEAQPLLPPEDAAQFQSDVIAPWAALEASAFEVSISEVLTEMQNVSSTPALAALLARIDEGTATVSETLRATARRRLTSQDLRAALRMLQASISTTNSERASWQYDATQLSGAERREATATAASLARTLTALSRNRSAAIAAVDRWRRRAARESLLQIFARVFGADTHSTLEGRLND